MKKIPTYIAILLFATAIMCISSCDKKEPEPPESPAPPMLTEATQTGEHSLSFMLNDEVWVSRTGWGDLESTLSVSSKTLLLDSQGPTGKFGLSLTLNEWSPDIYIYSQHDKGRSGSFTFGIAPNDCWRRFAANPLDSFNVVEITHLETSQTNPNEQWISANFQMRMIEKSEGGCGDTIYISDGRFDIRYQATP